MEEITVILNGYKRPEYLEEQIQAIRSQTIPPKEIWLWINRSEYSQYINFPWDELKGPDLVVDSSRNFKYHGRFALGLLARTKYIAFFDDDTIPGRKWFENCIETYEHLRVFGCRDLNNKYYRIDKAPILGGAGVELLNKSYVNHIRYGWPRPCFAPMPVDLVGHAWFLPQEYVKYLWEETPISLDNGEDIQLSYLAQKHGIMTICPAHNPTDKNTWSSLKAWEYGGDKKASSNGGLMPIPEFYAQRDKIIEEAINRGWQPLFMRK